MTMTPPPAAAASASSSTSPAASAKALVESLSVPSDMESLFKPIQEAVKLSWSGFVLLTAAEKRKILKKAKTSDEHQRELENAVCKDERKVDLEREDFDAEIAAAVKMAAEPDPLPVGLKNQSSTCYLNALMQALYNVTYFRNMIYEMVVAPDTKPNESIALALQRLFFSLQMRQKVVTTVELTQAFGWDQSQSAIQHDIHELTRKLLDELESQMEGTEQADAIKKMMVGKILYATHCLDTEQEQVSRREEVFYDLEMTVKGNKNLVESLKTLCSTEKFDFKYEYEHPDGTTTKHEAERRTSLKVMPPILLCHPNRLHFDMNTMQSVTIPDRWEFTNEVDIAPFLEEAQARAAGSAFATKNNTSVFEDEKRNEKDVEMERSNTGQDWERNNSLCMDHSTTYVLNSVIIHTGGAGFGHYYAICRHGDKWIKLNDQDVSEVTQEQMEQDAFAGKRTYTDTYGRTQEFQSSTKCAMMVYINKSLLDKVIFKIDPESLPGYLHAGLDAQRAAGEKDEMQRQQDAASISFACIGISTDPTYLQDFANKDKRKSIKVKKDGDVSDLAAAAHEYFGLPKDKVVRCWFYHEYYAYGEHYKNHPALYHKPDEKLRTGSSGCLAGFSDYGRKLLFCNVVEPDAVDPFDMKTCKLLHAMQYIDGKCRFVAVFESSDDFLAYFDLKNVPQVVFVNTGIRVTVVEAMTDLVGGHVLIVAPKGTKVDIVTHALDVMYNSIEVTIYRLGEDGQGDELFPLQLTEKTVYADVQKKILETLAARASAGGLATEGEIKDGIPEDFEQIGLRKHDSNSDSPHRFLSTRTSGYHNTPITVKDLCSSGHMGMVSRIYYNVLPTTITKIEKNWLECMFSAGEMFQQVFYVNLNDVSKTWSTVFKQVRDRFPERFTGSEKNEKKQIRCVTLYSHTRVDHEYTDPEAKTPGSWNNTLFVFDELPERDPVLDVDMEEGKLLRMDVVNVCRASGTEDFHGVPTCVYVNAKDTGKTLLKKIVDKMEVPEDQNENAIKHWRVLYRAGSSTTTMLKPDEEVYPIVKGYAGGTMTFSQFLMVDRYPRSGMSNKASKRLPAVRRAEPELKIRSQKDRDRASESPTPGGEGGSKKEASNTSDSPAKAKED